MSRIFNIRKKKVTKAKSLRQSCVEAASAFYTPDSTKAEVANAGEKLLISIYNRNDTNSLDKLRAKMFLQKVDGKNSINSESLPPTTEATSHHSYRVYHQVQTWLGRAMPPEDWGWRSQRLRIVPCSVDEAACT